MQLIEIPMPEISPLWWDFVNMVTIFKIGCACIATRTYWRQRSAIARLRGALYLIHRETQAPYFDGETNREAKVRSWAVIQSVCAHELRTKRW